MGTEASFPQTTKEVLAVILAAERSRKYVWTASRVIIEGGFVGSWKTLDSKEKKTILKSVTKHLGTLSATGVLVPRPDLQNIGFGQEKGFDYVRRTVRSDHSGV